MDLHDIWTLIVRALMRSFSVNTEEGQEIATKDQEQPKIIIQKSDSGKDDKQLKQTRKSKVEGIPEELSVYQNDIDNLLNTLEEPQYENTDRFGLGNIIPEEAGSDDEREQEELLHEVLKIIRNKKSKDSEPRPSEEARRILKKKERDEEKLQPFKEQAKRIRETIETFKHKPKTNMIYFVMYDIEDDKVRKRVSDYLMEKGLYRVQRSIFLGETHQREFKKIGEVLAEIQSSYDNHDSIFLVPLSEDYLKSMHIIGKEIDFAVTLHRSNTVFI